PLHLPLPRPPPPTPFPYTTLFRSGRPLRLLEPQASGGPLALDRRSLGQARLAPVQLRRERVLLFPDPLLRDAQLLVPQHARQEGGALGPGQLRHHGEILLPREVGIEELVVRHAEPALELRRHLREGIRDELPVLVQLGGVQPPDDFVLVRADPE